MTRCRARLQTPVWLMLLLMLALPAALAQAQSTVSTSHINGEPVKGKVDRIENDQLFLRDVEPAGAPTQLSLREVEELDYLDQRDAETPGDEWALRLILSSGDIFIGRVVGEGADGFIFESMAFGRFPVDIGQVERIEVRKNLGDNRFEADPDYMDKDDDALYLSAREGAARGDVTGGTLDAVLPIGPDFVDKAEILMAPVPWREVLAVTRHIMDRPRQPDEFQAIVACRNGERFTGKLLKLADRTYQLRSYLLKPETIDKDAPEAQQGRHTDGLTLSVRDERLLKVTLRHGKFAYVSDLEVTAMTEYPWFGGRAAVQQDKLRDYWWHFRRDQAVTGGQLQLMAEDGRPVIYTKGLGVHSYCDLTFNLDSRYVKFLADIGIDYGATEQASVNFLVYVDNERQPRFRTASVVRRSAPLQSIEVNVRGARTLRLVVDFGDNGDIQDRAIWAKARVIKDE